MIYLLNYGKFNINYNHFNFYNDIVDFKKN